MKISSLSSTMVSMYLSCPYKFYCNYALRLPWIPNPNLAFGSAFHEMARENYYQKVQSGKDLPAELLECFFAEDLEYRDVEWTSEQSLDKMKDQGVKTVRAYQQKVAPSIHPQLVEHAWTMEVGRPWVVSGKTDLVTVENQVRELKTTGKKIYKPWESQYLQAATYTLAWRQQSGLKDVQAQIDYAIRGEDVVFSFPLEFGDSLGKLVLTTFQQVARGIKAEVWPANRGGSYLCSRKYCDFWNQCEEDCGGTVAH